MESSEVLQPSKVIGSQGSTGTAVPTIEEGRAGTGTATPSLEEAGMLVAASPPSVEVPEAGPTSLGGGLHEEGDPDADEMWRAAHVGRRTSVYSNDHGGMVQAVWQELRLWLWIHPRPVRWGVWSSGTLPELGCHEGGRLH
jgi:hypothetical protein